MEKEQIEDLAIFGGPQAVREKLHVGRPNIANKNHFIQRVSKVLESGWLTNNGAYVQEFERKLAVLLIELIVFT